MSEKQKTMQEKRRGAFYRNRGRRNTKEIQAEKPTDMHSGL